MTNQLPIFILLLSSLPAQILFLIQSNKPKGNVLYFSIMEPLILEDKTILDEILTLMPDYTGFNIHSLIEQIPNDKFQLVIANYNGLNDLRLTTFLLKSGLATEIKEERDRYNPGVLGWDGPPKQIEIELTDAGRKLKEKGSLRKYKTWQKWHSRNGNVRWDKVCAIATIIGIIVASSMWLWDHKQLFSHTPHI